MTIAATQSRGLSASSVLRFGFTLRFRTSGLGIFGHEFWRFQKLPRPGLVSFTIKEEKYDDVSKQNRCISYEGCQYGSRLGEELLVLM